MYFDKIFYDENYNPILVQFICDKCGEYIEVKYDKRYIDKVKNEYCIVTNGNEIRCKCGNLCQNGIVEPKKLTNIKYSKSLLQTKPTTNIPQCPYCNSTDLKRISAATKAVNVALFGLFGNKRKYQWHCNNCKSDF